MGTEHPPAVPAEHQWPQHSRGHAGSSLGIVSRAPHSLCIGGSLSHFPEEVEAGRNQLATTEQESSLGLVALGPVLGPIGELISHLQGAGSLPVTPHGAELGDAGGWRGRGPGVTAQSDPHLG